MTDYASQTTEYREHEDKTRRSPVVDSSGVSVERHEGSVETVGVDEVLHSGDRGVDWQADSERSKLSQWGFGDPDIGGVVECENCGLNRRYEQCIKCGHIHRPGDS